MLGLVPVGTANHNSELLAYVRIQTASEASNKRGRYVTCVHTLGSPVGLVSWLLQSGQIAAWRISMNLDASCAVQELFLTLRESADAHGSCALVTASNKKFICRRRAISDFRCGGGSGRAMVWCWSSTLPRVTRVN